MEENKHIELPFGKTSTNVHELYDLINTNKAIKLLKNEDLDKPRKKIELFIQNLPELLSWLEQNGRIYPWRNTTETWRIYITEILLQRTRAEAVENVYLDFFKRFPNSSSLDRASEQEIRNTIRSLGFVNHRVKTLKDVGHIFSSKYNGEVPSSIQKLKEPWRVGEYTARACQLFSRGKPFALVDTNFVRVFKRLFNYNMPSQPHKSKKVYNLFDSLVPSEPNIARAFNLAILDLGSIICTDKNPSCEKCPINNGCYYFQKD